MAHVKSGGKTRQGTPRKGKRLGVKAFGGQLVKNGNIVIKQRGSTVFPGEGTKMGRDFTIYAIKEGKVKFRDLSGKKIIEII